MQKRYWLFFLALNAPMLPLTALHIFNSPNIYHYTLTEFVGLGLLAGNRLNTALGALAIVGYCAAAVAQPAWGALSDLTHSRLGPRYPYLLGGTAMAVVLLTLMANAGSWLVLVIAVIGTQIALNAVQSPAQALIPDYVLPNRMGLAASIKTVLELFGIIGGGLLVWLFLGTHSHPEQGILLICSLLLIATAWGMWNAPQSARITGRQQARSEKSRLSRRYQQRFGGRYASGVMLWQNTRHVLRRRPLRWWLVGRFFFYASFNTMAKFMITYLADVYGYSGEEAREIQGLGLVVIGLLIFGTTIGAGVLADGLGRRRLATFGALISAVSAALLVVSPALPLAVLLICIIGIGAGIYFSTGWALVTYLVPSSKAAFYLGILNLATTLGGAFGMLGGYMVDRVNDTASSPAVGYGVLFGISAVFFIISAFTTYHVTEPSRTNLLPLPNELREGHASG